MQAGRRETKPKTLREHLREATAHSHDRLDTSMRPPSDWRSREDYARFLSVQYCARIPVERWLSTFAPADLRPPEQTHLLVSDLINLGIPIPKAGDALRLDYRGRATAIGVAWVLAGSSLGNKAMLLDMQRTLPPGTRWPHYFLGGDAMAEFWKTLRSGVEVAVDAQKAQEATRAATCVFDHFLKTARSNTSQKILAGAQ